MKIAIHHSKGSFSDRWIQYCENNRISYKIVDCFKSDIINQVRDCEVFLWLAGHVHYASKLAAAKLINAIEKMGIEVFPSWDTYWHYDDKIAQKYLLEAINAPLASSYVFYNKSRALEWIQNAEYPIIFKLTAGASSANVKLIKTKREAEKIVKKAFNRGFNSFSGVIDSTLQNFDRIRKKKNYFRKVMQLPNLFTKIRTQNKYHGKQIGYVYFQELLPGNSYDTRITVIGNRAFGFRRYNRKNDFRASGSGNIDYNPDLIQPELINIAFHVSKSINAQSMAYDFLYDENNKPTIIEISYCYLSSAIYKCHGYWDGQLKWNEGNKWPEDCIIEDMINSYNLKQR